MLDKLRNKTQSFGVKLIFGIIILVFVFWGVGNMGGMSSGSLASVNGDHISVKDFSKALGFASQAESKRDPELFSDEEKFKSFKRRVLAEMIYSRLRQQEAERLGIMVTPHELKAYIDSFSVFQDDNGKFDPELYKTILAANNIGPGEFEADSRSSLIENKLMRYISLSAGVSEAEAKQLYAFTLEKRFAEYVLFGAQEYGQKAEVSEAEITAYYEANKEVFRKPVRGAIEYLRLTPDSLAVAYPVTDEEAQAHYDTNIENFKRPQTFQARHIFIPAPPDGSTEPGADEAIAEAGADMAEVEARLKDGGDFSELAKVYSKDVESAQDGGMLGWLEPGQSGSKEFDDAALALEAGQVSGPVRSAFGFHIIRLESKKEAFTVPLVEVKNSIVAELGREKADADFANVEKKAEDGLAMNSSLADIGKELSLKPQESGLIAQEDLEKLLSLHSDARQLFVDALAASAADGSASTIPVPLGIANGIALVRVLEAKSSEIPPLGEVGENITATLKSEKALGLARAAAEAALPSFTGKELPQAFKDKAATSTAVIRVFQVVEPLGPVASLVEGLFSSSGAWLPKVYDTPRGPVIARTSSVEKVKDEEWEQLKGIFIAQYQQKQEADAMDAFMQDIFNKAKIEENPGMLDSLAPQRR